MLTVHLADIPLHLHQKKPCMHVGHKPQYNVCQVNIITVQSLKHVLQVACTVLGLDSPTLALLAVLQLAQKALQAQNMVLPK